MRSFFLFCFGLLTAFTLKAQQNFVPNGGFEDYVQCPQTRNDGRTANSWDVPTKGTADYFNTCASAASNLDIPTNFAGTQTPRTGNAYSGIYASQNFASPFLEYREYMQVNLDSFLLAGGVYTFEMYVSLGDNSNFASNKLGAYISVDKPTSTSDTYLDLQPQIVSTSYITDKSGWTKITGVYVAVGGEHYITIGIFEPAASNTTMAVSGGSNSASYKGVSYYYIDDVSMTRACDIPDNVLGDDIKQCVSIIPATTLSAGLGTKTYLWSTGETSATITVQNPGTYFVKVNTPFCTKSDTITIEYPLYPKVNLGPDTTFCSSVNLTLDAENNGALFNWNVGATTELLHVTIPAKYIVSVFANGCMSKDTIQVSLDTLPPLELGTDLTLCEGSNKLLNAFSQGSTYVWQNGTTQSSLLATHPGTYWVEVTHGACVIKDSITIQQQAKPTVNIGPDTSYCFQQPVTLYTTTLADRYLWQDSSTSSSQTETHAGIYWLEIQKGVCTVRDTAILSQKTIPVVNLGPDRKICKESVLTYNFSSVASQAVWNNLSTDLSRHIQAPGLFYVYIENAEGCSATDTVLLDTFTSPIVNLGQDSFVCTGSTFQIDPGVYNSYTWQDGSHVRFFKATSGGSYFVTITDRNACTASDSMVLVSKNKPDIELIALLKICDPDTTLTVTGNFDNLMWSDGSTSASRYITEYGTYLVTASDAYCSNSASLEVQNNCPPNIYVPNAFTPENRDGINDQFLPVIRNVKEIDLKIFNRWGELLFETTELSKGWDGTFQNQSVAADVYVYSIRYTGANDRKGTLSGNVTLLK